MKLVINSAFYLFLLLPTVNAEINSSKPTSSNLETFADEIYTATIDQQTLPYVADKNLPIDEQSAYKIQRNLVNKLTQGTPTKTISGFKAGLTSKAGQAKFSVTKPVYGVLFNTGWLAPDQPIFNAQHHRLMLETELGFVINQDIKSPLKSIAQLKLLIGEVVPVIEFPDIRFTQLNKITGLDLIASNVASNRYLLGTPMSMKQLQRLAQNTTDFISLNQMAVKLNHSTDGSQQEILTGKGSDASGNQWQALKNLINHQIESGYHLKSGQIFITGALGKMVPAKAGKYHADFGLLGSINFEVKQ